jgi:DNA-binding MarR family transcriptional regulator
MILLDRERLGLSTSQSDLAEHLGLDKSNVARVCARLQADEHAKQEVAPDDARSRRVELTQRGRRIATNIQAASLERFQRVLAAVPRGKRKAVLESLDLLRVAVGTLGEEST